LAASIALLGATGVLVSVLGLAALAVRGLDGELAFVSAFLGFMSTVMLVAGAAAARSGMVVVHSDGDALRWVDSGHEGTRPRAGLRLTVRVVDPASSRQLPYYTIALVDSERRVLIDKLHFSLARPLATRRLRRIAQLLGLTEQSQSEAAAPP